MKSKKILAVGLLGAALGLVIFAAVRNQTPQAAPNTLQVAASYYPLYDFAKQIGGDKISVTNITGTNEPHDFDPSPRAIINAQKSDVFIYNGGQLEPWATRFVGDYTHTVVKASTHITLQTTADEGDTNHKVADPHFWLDPVLVKQVVANIAQGLITADPAHQAYYAHNAKIYTEQLTKLDTDFRTGLAHCQIHTVISSHQAFGYLGKRYGLTIIPIAGISPEEEPSPAKLSELSDLVKAKDIKYVFFESLASQRLADTIATETGAKTLVFDPIERVTNEAQNHGKDYLSIQRDNLANLRTALACQ